MGGEHAPDEWGNSLTIPLYKGKRDALQGGKYRGLRLLEHGMKVWERVLNERLKQVTNVGKNQFGFRVGKSTAGAIFIVRQLQEKYLEKKKKLYHSVVHLEKAFDNILRTTIRWALRRQNVPERLINSVMALYIETRSSVRVAGETSVNFGIEVGVHQGSVLSPLLFIVVMEEATKEWRVGNPWELLYADDLVLTAESREGVEALFGEWRGAFEWRGLKVNLEKTKLMVMGGERGEVVQVGRYPCGVCGRGAGVNSTLCISCNTWCHKRCSGLGRLGPAVNIRCPTCVEGVVMGVVVRGALYWRVVSLEW